MKLNREETAVFEADITKPRWSLVPMAGFQRSRGQEIIYRCCLEICKLTLVDNVGRVLKKQITESSEEEYAEMYFSAVHCTNVE